MPLFLPVAAVVNVLPPPAAAVIVVAAAPPAESAGSSFTPEQRAPPPGPPSPPAGGARRRPARTQADPQGASSSSFASPDLPGVSCSSSSPDTPRLGMRLQPVVLQFSAEAAPGTDETDGGIEGVRERGGRGGERRGREEPEGGEGEGEGGRE